MPTSEPAATGGAASARQFLEDPGGGVLTVFADFAGRSDAAWAASFARTRREQLGCALDQLRHEPE